MMCKVEFDESCLVDCKLCGSKTSSAYLRSHIRFNHLINNEALVDQMIGAHDRGEATRTASSQTKISWIYEKVDLNPREDSPLYLEEEADEDVEESSHDNDGGGEVEDADEDQLCPECKDMDDTSAMIACEDCKRSVPFDL